MKITLAVTLVLAWAAFLYCDAQWNACISRAVEEGRKTYGELYGPLSFARPLAMYLALTLSVMGAGLLVVGEKGRKP